VDYLKLQGKGIYNNRLEQLQEMGIFSTENAHKYPQIVKFAGKNPEYPHYHGNGYWVN